MNIEKKSLHQTTSETATTRKGLSKLAKPKPPGIDAEPFAGPKKTKYVPFDHLSAVTAETIASISNNILVLAHQGRHSLHKIRILFLRDDRLGGRERVVGGAGPGERERGG